MKRLFTLSVVLIASAAIAGDAVKMNKTVVQTNDGSEVHLSVTKNADNTYSLNVAAVSGVITTTTSAAPTDGSGSITTGGSSQQVFAAKAGRVYFEYQNISDETQYINFGAAATTDNNSFKIPAGASYTNPPQFCPNGTITVIGATTGKKFVAKQQ